MATSITDNLRNSEVLEKLTNEYKNQCKHTWEDSIKKGLDETVSAIKRAKAEVAYLSLKRLPKSQQQLWI